MTCHPSLHDADHHYRPIAFPNLISMTTTSTITTIKLPTGFQHHRLQPDDQGCGLPLHAGHNDRGGSQRQRQPPRRAWKVQTNNLKWMIVKLTWSKMSSNKAWENILWARLPSSRSKLGKTCFQVWAKHGIYLFPGLWWSSFSLLLSGFSSARSLLNQVSFFRASNKTSRFQALPTSNISTLRNLRNALRAIMFFSRPSHVMISRRTRSNMTVVFRNSCDSSLNTCGCSCTPNPHTLFFMKTDNWYHRD